MENVLRIFKNYQYLDQVNCIMVQLQWQQKGNFGDSSVYRCLFCPHQDEGVNLRFGDEDGYKKGMLLLLQDLKRVRFAQFYPSDVERLFP